MTGSLAAVVSTASVVLSSAVGAIGLIETTPLTSNHSAEIATTRTAMTVEAVSGNVEYAGVQASKPMSALGLRLMAHRNRAIERGMRLLSAEEIDAAISTDRHPG